MQKLFGKNYEEIGSLDKNLVLQTAGKIKIHYGRRYFDLLNSKGELNVDLQDIIQPKKSLDDIDENGFYFVDGDLVAYVNGQIIQLASGGEGSTYVSFIEDQDEKGDAKEKAMTNIGFLYKTLQDVKNPPTNGIIYVESEKAFYIVQNGEISKYTIDFPNPYPERFVIQKIDQSSNGAIYIMGEGIQNSLYFDGLAIFQEGGKAFYESDLGHNFYVGGQNVFNITLKGAETNGIQSPGATSNVGYRIYQEGGRYILDIDSIHVRDGIQAEESLVPVWYYNEENLIKEYSLNGRQGYLVLKYLNTYKVGDKIQVYTDFTPEGQSYKQMVLVKGTVTTVEGNQIGVTFDSDVLSDLTNNKINLVERDFKPNNSLIIGEIGSVYNGEHEGIVSKQNIFYSGEYTTDTSSNSRDKTIYPFYSDELYAKFEEIDSLDYIPPGMEKIIPPYGKTKLNQPLRDINNAQLGPASNYHDPITLQNVLDNLKAQLNRGPEEDYNPYDWASLETGDTVISYNNNWQYSSSYNSAQLGSFLNQYTIALTTVMEKHFSEILERIKEGEEQSQESTSQITDSLECVTSALYNNLKIPIGTILMWGKSESEIPEGWHICDGTNGTPNLTDKFIIAAGPNHPAGSSKEATEEDSKLKFSFQLTEENLPEHKHQILSGKTRYDNAEEWAGSIILDPSTKKDWEGDVWEENRIDRKDTTKVGQGKEVEVETDYPEPPYYALIYIMKVEEIPVDTSECGIEPPSPTPVPDPDPWPDPTPWPDPVPEPEPPVPPVPPQKWRGTDNGSDLIDGVWYSHPCNLGWKGSGSDIEDSICVDTLYINGTNVKTNNVIKINDWWTIVYHSGGPWGKGYLEHVLAKNESDQARSAICSMTTEDTGNLTVGPNAGKPVVDYWQYEMKQASKNHYWDCWNDEHTESHSYWSKLVSCPCTLSSTDGYAGYEDCEEEPPTPPDPETYAMTLAREFEDAFGGTLTSGTIKNYLINAYDAAERDFNTNSGSWDPSIYLDNGITATQYYQTGGDSEVGFKAYVSWLYAMILTELKPSVQNALYEKAYQLGEGDYPLYGHGMKNNPNFARLAASILYAKNHNIWNNSINICRVESIDYNTVIKNIPESNFLNYFPDGSNFSPNYSNFIKPNNESIDLEIDLASKNTYGVKIDPDFGLINKYDQSVENLRATQAIYDNWCEDGYHFAKIFSEILNFSPYQQWKPFMYEYEWIASRAYLSTRAKNERYRPPKLSGGNEGYVLQDSNAHTEGEQVVDITPRKITENLSATSYPSGHSSTIWGLTLMMIQKYPDKYKELAHRAWIFANNRVVARYHFFSDTIHGRITGSSVLPTLNHYNSFINDLNSL